ncbi:hypothetical protein [Kordia sp.]|uniref:hypothetical protein n=1 Tax=Kordia sp. TaxID=1965332 RepID=UPI003D6A3177
MKNLLWIVCIIFLSVISCSKSPKENLITEDYKFFNLAVDDGWKSKRINQYINNINYTATEVPLHYYILKDNQNFEPKKVDSIFKLHKNERIVEIEFSHDEEKELLLKNFTNMSYDKAVEYMAFKIQKDFKVITSSKDTIVCSGALFERNFKVAPFKRALLYFGNIPETDNIQLLYNDQLFGNGIIKFNFKSTPLKL